MLRLQRDADRAVVGNGKVPQPEPAVVEPPLPREPAVGGIEPHQRGVHPLDAMLDPAGLRPRLDTAVGDP
jgi:hypothetical protein